MTITITYRDTDTHEQFSAPFLITPGPCNESLEAARLIRTVQRFINLELLFVDGSSDLSLETFKAYCATLKPAPVTW